MKFMSFAQYARYRGISKEAVGKAVRDGRIKTSVGPKGKLGVDKDEADKDWAANTQSMAKDFVNEVVGTDDSSPDNEGDTGESPKPMSYNEARIAKEQIQAKLLQLKYDELSGELVQAKDVETEWANLAVKVKTKVLGIASKMKQRYSELSLEQYGYLDLLTREALEEIADGKD